jgi:hypothetical protein
MTDHVVQIAAIAAAAATLLIDLLLHRFQRTTLAIANLQTVGKGSRQEIARLQMAMTPFWIVPVALLEKLMAVTAAVLLYVAYAWWGVIGFGLLYLMGIFAGIGGVFIPIMPYPFYLASIEKYLESSRLKLVTGQRLPAGATVDIVESMALSHLANGLAEDSANGKTSVEAIAAGRIGDYQY